MSASVSSAFYLEDRATPAVHSIRRELRGLQVDAEQTGRALDALTGPRRALQMEELAAGARSVRDEFQKTRVSIDDQARGIETRLDRLQTKFEKVGRVTARPSVQLAGFDRANAELSALEARLDRLDRRRATARVAVGLSGGGFAGGGGGGGGSYSGMSGRGGRPPTLFSAVGGLPGISLAALGLTPAVLGLLGGAAAVASSAGSAALGAGSVGLGGLGPLAVGGGLTALAGKQAVSGLQTVTKAQQAYNEAVADYGRRSTEAATAQRKLNVDIAANPAAAAAAGDLTRFQSRATAAFAPARGQFYRGTSGVLGNATRALPAVGADARIATGASASAAIAYSRFLTDPTQLGVVRQLTNAFAGDLPIAERSLENITSTIGHLAVAATPFFHEADLWVERWSAGLAKSSANTLEVQGRMRGYVSSARDWSKLAGAAYRDIRDIFDAGAPTGDSMVVELTHTLDRWDVWLQRNPQKVQSFFSQSATTTGKIATAMGGVLTDVEQLAHALAPVFDRLTDVLSFLTGLGPGGLGLGGALLYGGYGGLRGATGSRLPSAGSLAGAFVTGSAGPSLMRRSAGAVLPGSVAAGGALMGGAAARRASNFEVATGQARDGAFLMGPATEGTAGAVARRAGFGAAEEGVLGGMLARPGVARAADAAVGLRGLAGSALSGAARFALPVLGINALLQATSAPGGAGNKLLAGVNSVPGGAGGVGALAGFFGSRALGAGLLRSLALGGAGAGLGVTAEALIHPASAGADLGNANTQAALKQIQQQSGNVRTSQQLHQFQAMVQGVRLQYELSPDQAAKLRKFLHDASITAAQNAGISASNTWQDSFTKALDRGVKPGKAVETMLSGMLTDMKQLGPQGRRTLAAGTAVWVSQLEADNPKLRRPLERLMGGITDDLNHLDHKTGTTMKDLQGKVFFFNGQILTGSQKTWGQIRDALVNPAEVAKEKLSGIFGQIQVEAINALTGMGFSRSQAKQIVTEQAAGGQLAANAGAAVATKQATGKSVSPLGAAPSNLPKKRATGGRAGGYRLPGTGTLDTVAMSDGGFGAPGELVVNRWTERDIDRDLSMAGKPSLEQRVRRETRKHSDRRYATGGWLATAYGPPWGGIEGGGQTATGIDLHNAPHKYIIAVDPSVIPLHSNVKVWPNPFGYTGTFAAEDTGGAIKGNRVDIYDWMGRANQDAWGRRGVSVQVVGGPLGGAARGFGAGAGAAATSLKALKAPRSGLGGIPGVMADAAGRIFAAGLTRKVNSRLAAMAPAGDGVSIPGGGATSGPPGLAVFEGVTMAKWIANELEWGTQHGWHGQPTSGYRPGFDPHTKSGKSEHALINYPGGAVDFGGFTDPGAYATKLALVELAARLNYPGPRLKMPIGFHDDGHLSGTGHSLGGRLSGPAWGGWNAKGADVIVRRPTLFGAGERGAERVQITPQHGPGGSGVSIGSVQVNVTGGISDRRVHKLLDRRLKQFAQDVADEIEAGQEEPASLVMR